MPVTLLVFCKRPKIRQGKQRIAATLGAAKALQVAEALLDCALEDAAAWPGPVVIAPASQEDETWARALLPGCDYAVVAQPEGNLGTRINALDKILRSRGHDYIVIIGTDAPVLGYPLYSQARRLLADNEIVLSSADDGGVTLMTSSVPWPDISALPWSTEKLGQALHDACTEAGLTVAYTQPSYDVDLATDLSKLARDLREDPRSARRKLHALLCEMLSDGLNPD
ncbi:MAG: hypothetical protein CSA61_01550 [Neptuniibacter caesariensis]|uniref:DUF2064 domain-containing protein n=1 Tax=Neptuniibacter caesariensis TaxID=207954 RepID=A0A2G6JB16_NEPCE|nr:MAG: hypothetical protein CSA61_01550 [Neptuniibacter caesariensis]